MKTGADRPPLYRSAGAGVWDCLLCPHRCRLAVGRAGICGLRRSDEQGIRGPEHPVTVIAADPVEKKPFYHFLPGTRTLSLGFAGCNLRCPFCQNHELVDSRIFRQDIDPEAVLKAALEHNLPSVSYTYSEPLIHIEFLAETSALLRRHGIRTLLVTNGCINPEPARWLLSLLDGVKVDLKSYDQNWYQKELGGDLEAVKGFIRLAAESRAHLEVVTLVITGRNDSDREIGEAAAFLADLDPEIPYHLTGYHPQHRYTLPPTSVTRLKELQALASEHLSHVYTGNTGIPENSRCADCGAELILRGYGETECLLREGCCPECGKKMKGLF